MKNYLILFWILLMTAGCAANRTIPAAEAQVRTEIKVPGQDKQKIFDESEKWITRNLYSEGKIIETADRNTGIIVAEGSMDYPAEGKLESMAMIQYKISFTMREEIRESVVDLSFTNLELYIPKTYWHSRRWPFYPEYTGGFWVPIRNKSHFLAAKRGVLEIARRLGDYLKNGHFD